jgi:putative phosphoesterase
MSDTTLLILSDSHGRPDRIREAIRRTRPDGILFAGDGLRDLTDCDLPCPLWAVKGNCDFSTPLIVGGALLEANGEELFTLAGIRILLTHGHHDQVKGGLGLLAAHGAACAADLVVFGHTHIPMEYRLTPDSPAAPVGLSKPMILFNPGSLGDREASFGTLTIRNGQMLPGHGNL